MKKVFLNALLITCVNFAFSQTESFSRINLTNTVSNAVLLSTGTGSGVQKIALSNDDITGINKLFIRDLGLSEGIVWGANMDISVDNSATYGSDAFTFRTTSNYPFLFKSTSGTAQILLKGTSGQGGGGGGLINFGGGHSIKYSNAPTVGGQDLIINNSNGKGLFLGDNRVVINNKVLFTNSSVLGNFSIATVPDDFLLAVDGKAIAEEMWVQNSTQWPDYVFDKDYELRPLKEVVSFIAKNSHLPEVPSAKEIEEKGINTGEMHAVLLKKVEELTLYIIENKNAINLLQEENIELKKQLSLKK